MANANNANVLGSGTEGGWITTLDWVPNNQLAPKPSPTLLPVHSSEKAKSSGVLVENAPRSSRLSLKKLVASATDVKVLTSTAKPLSSISKFSVSKPPPKVLESSRPTRRWPSRLVESSLPADGAAVSMGAQGICAVEGSLCDEAARRRGIDRGGPSTVIRPSIPAGPSPPVDASPAVAGRSAPALPHRDKPITNSPKLSLSMTG